MRRLYRQVELDGKGNQMFEAVRPLIRRCRGSVIGVFFVLALGGCSSGTSKVAIERDAAMLHGEIRGQRYQQIYEAADRSMHDAIDAPTFLKSMHTIAEKLGRPVSSTLQNYGQSISIPLGRTVVTQFSTKFEKGEGTEHITWRVRDGRLVLVGYYVDSPVFAR